MKIEITNEALADLLLAIHLCPIEISGMGKVKKAGDNHFVIEEIVVFEQKCSIGGTDFDLNARGYWLHKMMSEGKGEEINLFRLWWHSHVYSKARWSSTDENNIEEFNGCEYIISIVGNKRNILRVRLDFFKPERKTYDGLKLIYGNTEDIKTLMKKREEKMKETIERKVCD